MTNIYLVNRLGQTSRIIKRKLHKGGFMYKGDKTPYVVYHGKWYRVFAKKGKKYINPGELQHGLKELDLRRKVTW